MLSSLVESALERIKTRVNLDTPDQQAIVTVIRGIRELCDILIDRLEARPEDESDAEDRTEYGS